MESEQVVKTRAWPDVVEVHELIPRRQLHLRTTPELLSKGLDAIEPVADVNWRHSYIR